MLVKVVFELGWVFLSAFRSRSGLKLERNAEVRSFALWQAETRYYGSALSDSRLPQELWNSPGYKLAGSKKSGTRSRKDPLATLALCFPLVRFPSVFLFYFFGPNQPQTPVCHTMRHSGDSDELEEVDLIRRASPDGDWM